MPGTETSGSDGASDRHGFAEGELRSVAVLFDRFRLTNTHLFIKTSTDFPCRI